LNKEFNNHSIIDDFGYFWFPGTPEIKIAGTIKRDNIYEHFHIQLLKENSDFKYLQDHNKYFSILHGNLSSIGDITLHQIRVVSVSSDGNYKLDSEYLFSNILIEEHELEYSFENYNAKVFIDGLCNWQFHNNKEILLDDVKNPIVKLNEGIIKSYSSNFKDYVIDYQFIFTFLLRDQSVSDLDIRDYSCIDFHFKQITFTDFITFIIIFRDLLSMLWGFPAVIQNIEITFHNDKLQSNFLMRQFILKKYSIKQHEDEFKVKFCDLENQFDKIVNKWFELNNKIPKIIDIMTEQQYNSVINLNNDFLAICRAIEALYRPKCKQFNKKLQKKRWHSLKNELNSFLSNHQFDPEKLNQFIEITEYKNKITLKDVFKQIKNDLEELFIEDMELSENSIDEIVDFRNILTHDSHKCITNEELKFYAIVRLIFNAIILKELNIDHQIINRALSKDNFFNVLKSQNK